MSELWEIVRADELKVGDVVLDLRGGAIDSYEVGPELVEIAKNSPKNFYPPKLRRISDADDPRVLRRALENELTPPRLKRSDAKFLVEMAIDEARKELESEAGK